MYAIGVDIGGTKCAVCLGEAERDTLRVICKGEPRKTAEYSPELMLEGLLDDVKECLSRVPAGETVAGIGISCGNPLDSRTGLILSPPNLPGWDRIPVVDWFRRGTGLPAWLCNDANAGALAEWRFGAGKGCEHMIFLTFGTGFGAGLILNGRLYCGACDAAGETGHVRIAAHGPAGYGKIGSLEAFCSGGGIAQLARTYALREIQKGKPPAFCPGPGSLGNLTAESAARAARQGDPTAREVFELSGAQLGLALAMLIDLFNPQRIVLGGIFSRCRDLIWPVAEGVIREEALPASRMACDVVPCGFGEAVGDMAALTVALYYGEQKES
ncbi:glucokinase [Aminivibrio pyruvatiphilus]|uniref:Glucokinase n=1 Tax=Aminivibrio pyruvatiphilus TaxID=1005740 RepID=A0A4R8M876_9BACT|nr:ROK family protein [Aminivibrio pyruvatiphilus]TDY61749.1 glucokinase [Aminivibrio pyruvatiphilus]